MTPATKHAQFDAESEYKSIEQTLLESPRGRWFLTEHGRRARRLDSLTLHEAISKLQNSLREPPALLGQLRGEIEGLQSLLRETRDAITAQQPIAPSAAPTEAGDAAGGARGQVSSHEGVSSILSVAEAIHNLAWDLQSQDINVDACEKIARQASQMYALSHRHAVESERVKALTSALDGALERLDGLLETVVLEAQFDTFKLPEDVEQIPDGAIANEAAGSLNQPLAAPPAAQTSAPTSGGGASHGLGQDELDAFDLALARARADERKI